MGGKALGFETVRLLKADFLILQDDIISKLSDKFDKVLPTVWFREKESFGDLDLIVAKPVPLDIIEYLYKTFESTKVVYNGDCLENSVAISFDYKGFQTDLIFVQPDNLDIAHFYFAYNDLNNYVGRVAAQFGMKFGFNGLFYDMLGEEDILVSKDREKIYTFLGFNYQTYLKGFDKLYDTFQYIIFSKYFNSEIFQYENLNSINRARNAKRPNYQKFLDYLIENDIKGGAVYPNNEEALEMICAYFPEANLKWKLNQLSNEKLIHEKVKELLNSQIVKAVLETEDWEKVRKIIDQIYAIPRVEYILSGLKDYEISYLIKAAVKKAAQSVTYQFGDVIVFRTNDNKHVDAKLLSFDNGYVKVETSNMMVYRIKADRIRHKENWFDFKNELVHAQPVV